MATQTCSLKKPNKEQSISCSAKLDRAARKYDVVSHVAPPVIPLRVIVVHTECCGEIEWQKNTTPKILAKSIHELR